MLFRYTNYILVIISIGLMFISCSNNGRKNCISSDLIHQSLVKAAALSYPSSENRSYFNGEYVNHYKMYPDTLGNMIDELLLVRKRVHLEELGLELYLHMYASNCGHNYPVLIIYITNNKDFYYAFPFQDEVNHEIFKYSENFTDSINNSNQFPEELTYNYLANSFYQNNLAFEGQLNYIIDNLHVRNNNSISLDSKKHLINDFITIVFDSLLGVKEYGIEDTVYFRDRINTFRYSGSIFGLDLNEIRNKNFEYIILGLETNTCRYFRTFQGSDAFWEFNLTDELKIELKFVNKECYSLFYFKPAPNTDFKLCQ